ncbi:MAG: hypothetical protein Q6K99_01845 [Thermostichales cyanobacterium BF4_bins_65]
MRIHTLQHVPFEGLGRIADWAAGGGHQLSSTLFFADAKLPDLETIDALIIMGGPMNVDDEDRYPWLKIEKQLIEKAIAHHKTVLGICLGAQLIAQVLGARVFPNREREVGWFPILLTEMGMESPLFQGLPREWMVFHWHGDTFDLPQGAVHLAASAGCQHQAFSYGDKVLGLQFHLESTPESVQALLENSDTELGEGPYIQKPDEILTDQYFPAIHQIMKQLFDRLLEAKQ